MEANNAGNALKTPQNDPLRRFLRPSMKLAVQGHKGLRKPLRAIYGGVSKTGYFWGFLRDMPAFASDGPVSAFTRSKTNSLVTLETCLTGPFWAKERHPDHPDVSDVWNTVQQIRMRGLALESLFSTKFSTKFLYASRARTPARLLFTFFIFLIFL